MQIFQLLLLKINTKKFSSQISMSKIFRFLKQLIKSFDLFPSSQFLRYKQETQFKTATGGFLSIAVITIFIILFSNLGLQTVNKKIINGSVNYQIQAQPQMLNIEFKAKSSFMFAVGIFGFNLNDPNTTYFNISMRQNYLSPLFQTISSTEIPLLPCSIDHFSATKETVSLYNTLDLSQFLCPPFNFPFVVGGRVASPVYTQFSIYIQYCNHTINPKCLPNGALEYIQSSIGGSFALITPIISTIINPGEQNYKQVYLEDRNFYYITTKNGVELTAQIQQYQINTDVSLMPYSSIQTEYVTTIPNLLNVKTRPIANNLYAKIVFTKSSTTTVFTRSFNKVDDYFSYVGGLVGTLLLMFFFVNSYSQQCYLLSIASNIYTFNNETNIDHKSFNLYYFVCLYAKKVLNFIKIHCKWQQIDNYQTVMQEMEKQLNIAYLLRRINFFQEAIASIMNQYQFRSLLLRDKKSIEDAKKGRKKLFKSFKKVKEKQSNLQQNQSSVNNMLEYDNRGSKQIFSLQEIPQLKRQSSQNDQSQNTQSQKESREKLPMNNSIESIHQQRNPARRRKIVQRLNRKVSPQMNQAHSQMKIQRQKNQQLQSNKKQELMNINHENFSFEIN